MKAARQWVNDFGRSFASAVTSERVNLVEQIQADALEHATQLMTMHAAQPERAFNAVFNKMLRLRDQK